MIANLHGEYIWIRKILEDVSDVEAPDSFKLWALLFAVSSASKRQTLLSLRGKITVYPNLFVMLIADSGFGKQFSIDLAEGLLTRTKRVRSISGRNSIESIIESLGKSITIEGGCVINRAQGAVTSGEFANLLLENPSALTILTELYDCKDEWKNSLRKGIDTLRKLYIPMLTATNMEHFNDKIAEKDLKGGFIARTMLIKESKVSHLDSLLGEGPELDFEGHSKRLTEITELSGKFKITNDAVTYYDEWYHEFYSIQHNDKTGFIRRTRTHILKVAMCLSLIERDDLIVTLEHINDAKRLCLGLIDGSTEVSKQSGKGRYRSQMAIIVQQLIKAPKHVMTSKEIMNRNMGEFTYREFDEIIQSLMKGDYVTRTDVNEEPAYRLSDRAIAELEKIDEEEKK